jgi:hypothetical protein
LLVVVGTAGAQTVVFNPGVLRHQYWTSVNPNGVAHPSRVQVENGQAGGASTDTIDLTIFDTNLAGDVNYTERVSGLFVPTVTTNYVFWISSDDDSDLFVSTDATPANKKLVAQEAGWSNADQWHAAGSGGGSSAAQKRSDQFSPDSGATVPFKNGIAMVAGQKYWIEGVHQQGGGGENFGVTFSFKGGAEPTDGAKSALNTTNIGYGYTIPATLTVVSQATNATASDGREATFTYVVADPIPDPLLYQWYRNGTVISNATYQQYTFLASAADNSALYTCVVSLPASYNVSSTYTSSPAVLTVLNNSIAITNGLKVERFNNFVTADAEHGNTGPASGIQVTLGNGSGFLPLSRTGAEAIPNDPFLNYGRRMSGWYIAPSDGNYVFFLSSDDDADLFLSTDATVANKQLIAQENVWSGSRNWTNSPGGSVVSQKRSDQWTNTDGTATFAGGIPLLGGHTYYIEADSHQGGGGDNLGILAKLLADADPTNGTPPIPPTQLFFKTTVATNLSWVTQPKAVSVFDANQALFTGKATSDSEFEVLYQWQRNGTNIPGATSTSYSLTAIVADSGSTFNLIASTGEGDLSITSPPVALTVSVAVFEPNVVLMQYWLNKTADLTIPEGGAFGPPDFIMAVPAMAAGLNNENGNTYVNELSGFFVPTISQAYDFIVSGDDHIDVFLSTDANPNNKHLICQQPGWSGALAWDDGKAAGNGNNNDSDRNQMNSGTYTNTTTGKVNPNGIQLTAGTKYYIEVWHQEGGGGDSVEVTYVKHGDPVPGNGAATVMTGNVIGFNAPNTATFVAFTNEPVSVQTLSGTTATFTAGGISDGQIVIGTTGLFNNSGDVPNVAKFVNFPNVTLQWYRNGTAIPGATASSYTTPTLHPGDSAQYFATIRALGMAAASNSVTASLTVIADTNKPTVFAAEFDNNLNPVVSITFSKAMDLATLSDISHYTLGGAFIANLVVNSNDARHVQLQLAGEPASFPLQLTITGITDFSGNPPTTTSFSVQQMELVNQDIGDFSIPDPAFPGYMWASGTNGYDIMCEGSDIWNASDGFNYSYESKTGDFDVVVRQTAFTKVDNFSKGGLMVREDLTLNSRNWNIVNDPSSADGQQSIAGNGLGQNTVECNTRSTNNQASLSWATGPATVPAYPNAWVRMKRAGTMLSAYWSSNGVSWVQEALTDLSTNFNGALPATVYVGICCTAHDNDAQTVETPRFYYSASFDNYNSSFVAVNLPTIGVVRSGSTVTINYSGTLVSSGTVNGTYTPVTGATSPYTVPTGAGPAQFYKTK